MNFYFGRVDLNEFKEVPPEDLFNDGYNYYWYRAEIDDDQVCFYDTCGRHFPIALEHVGQADVIMFAGRELFSAQNQIVKIKRDTIERINQLTEFWKSQDE